MSKNIQQCYLIEGNYKVSAFIIASHWYVQVYIFLRKINTIAS